MTIQQLRYAQRATTFRPITVHLADERAFAIPHPDFLSKAFKGRTVIIVQPDEELRILDLPLMTEIEMSPVATNRT